MISVNPIVSPRIITVPTADGDAIDIQTLVNQIRGWEDDQANLSYPHLVSAAGKEFLGGVTYVGITATLRNAKIKFEPRTEWTICSVDGGNLVALDANDNPMPAIEPSAYVSVTLTASSSATLQGLSSIQSDISSIKAQTARAWGVVTP